MTPPLRALARAVAARHDGRWTRGFVAGKLRTDPMLKALLGLQPLGRVVDLGCGRGQLALALLLAGQAESVTGFDLDGEKIAQATASARDVPARFAVADLTTAAIPPGDTVLLIDVLTQMPHDVQRALLARIVAAAPARIAIRSLDPDRGWRSAVGFTTERLRRWFGADLSRGGRVVPLSIGALAQPLESAGYRVSVTPCWGGTPLPNVLIMAERS